MAGSNSVRLDVGLAHYKSPYTSHFVTGNACTQFFNLDSFEAEDEKGSILGSRTHFPASIVTSAYYDPKNIIHLNPQKTLSGDGIMDNRYLNIVDWSEKNFVAAALGNVVFCQDHVTGISYPLVEYERDHPPLCVSFYNEGRNIAVGLPNGKIDLFDVEYQKSIGFRGMEDWDGVLSLGWGGGNVIATGTGAGYFRLLDLRQMRAYYYGVQRHASKCCTVKVSRRGHWATGGDDNIVTVMDPRSMKNPTIFEGHNGTTRGIAWSFENENIIATSGSDRKIVVRNSQTLENVKVVDTKSQVGDLHFTQHGYLISLHGARNNEVNIWETKTYSKSAILEGHSASVLFSALDSTHINLVTASPDQTIRFWNLKFQVARVQ